MFSKCAFLRTLVLLFAVAISARAEAVEVIGGAVSRTGLLSGGSGFSLSGPSLTYSGGFSNFWWHSTPCDPCFPGDRRSVSNGFNLDTTDFHSASITIDGTTYFNWGSFGGNPTLPFARFTSFMDFSGGTFEVPFSDEPNLVLFTPFTMNGGVAGRNNSALLFGAAFTGSGFAALYLKRVDWFGTPAYMFEAISYNIAKEIQIDIKPGDGSNYINLRSEGKTPIAILSTAAFDATTLNPMSIRVAGAPVSLRRNGTTASSLEDVNGDGLLDLVIHVSTQALQLTNPNQVLLEGSISGQRFWGTDEIIMVP